MQCLVLILMNLLSNMLHLYLPPLSFRVYVFVHKIFHFSLFKLISWMLKHFVYYKKSFELISSLFLIYHFPFYSVSAVGRIAIKCSMKSKGLFGDRFR
jgi:hypothetical protein